MEKHNNTNDRLQVKASSEIHAPQADVFNAWLEPEMIGEWMFGQNVRDEKIVHLQTDAREGGSFSFVVDRGGQKINHIGTYLEIHRYTRLVFTWGIEGESDDASIVYIDITAIDNGCRVDLLHEMDPKWEAYVSRTQNAWMLMLGKLKELLGKD
jgi:uncharacterized protein YndB with AHSA1/START domain